MLFCTSLVAVVGAGDQPASSPRRLQIINTKVRIRDVTIGSLVDWSARAWTNRTPLMVVHYQRQSTICELTFPTSILSVKLNRKRLIVVLEDQIYVYDISNMKLLHTIETSPNPNGRLLFPWGCPLRLF